MACPFFHPEAPIAWETWPNPPRMPLGDPHSGVCTAQPSPAPEAHLRTCCNMGYARGQCPSFPAAAETADAVRFGIVRREAGIATIRYVLERNHLPFQDGTVELPESPDGAREDSLLTRQARAFLASYLRRNV